MARVVALRGTLHGGFRHWASVVERCDSGNMGMGRDNLV